MRKSFTLLLLVLTAMRLNAEPVSRKTAFNVAKSFALSQHISITDSSITELTPKGMFRQMYVFGLGRTKGFVIISADDRVAPILGYSFSNAFSTKDMPEHVHKWLNDYEKQIDWLSEHHVGPTKEIQRKWNALLNADIATKSQNIPVVGPLVTTKWNQKQYYNDQCPYYNGAHVLVGCVATATAQVMKYWNHPTSGHGSHSYTWNAQTLSADFGNTTYNWAEMPDCLNNYSTASQVDAVAKLSYHVGVALEMNYSNVGSSAFTYRERGLDPSAETILQTHFKYSNDIHTIFYSDMSDAQWKAILKDELNNGRVIIYDGRDPRGGHAFVCDGYDTDDLFSFNWGWGGSNDGFYAIGALNPDYNGAPAFNINNAAVVGIQPISDPIPEETTVNASSADISQGTVSGSGTYNQYDTITLIAIANEGYLFDHWDDNGKSNPRYAFATSPTFDRTAFFTPLPTDTLLYCDDEMFSAMGTSSQWGIRYPAYILSDKKLSAIQFLPYEEGLYTLNIYQGDGLQMALAYSQQFTTSQLLDWVTIPLTSPFYIDNAKSLWITLSYANGGYPMTFSSRYRGNRNGMMLYYGSEWVSFNDNGMYGSWLIKGITEQDNTHTEIENAELQEVKIACDRGNITISGAADYTIIVYDISGRMIASKEKSNELETFQVPSSGVYLVKTGNRPIVKVVVK